MTDVLETVVVEMLDSLPQGWGKVRLEEIAQINPRFKSDDLPDDTKVTFLPMKNVEELSGRIDLSETKSLSEVRKGYTPFKDGDIIFAKITPCMENGKCAVTKGLENGLGFGSTEFHVIRLHEDLPRSYLFYYLTQEGFRKEAERKMTGSAGQRRVPTKYMHESVMPFPPLQEQQRIISRVEELFTKLDAGVASLHKAQALLKRYRQSVLKAAVEGELSREWREAHPDVESAAALMERIQEGQHQAQGKKYKEAESIDLDDAPLLPSNWAWVSIEHLGEVIGGLTKNRKRSTLPLQLPYLRVANVYANELRLNEIEYTGVKETELNRLLLEPSDLLVVEGNGSPDQIGRVALWDGSISPCVHQNHLIKVRFAVTELGSFVLYWLLSMRGRDFIRQVASSTSGLYTLSLSKVKALPVPLPPLEEQRYIAAELERQLSIISDMEDAIEVEIKRSDRLRQSILKRAFSGKLVPQTPNDEPASVLLERIGNKGK